VIEDSIAIDELLLILKIAFLVLLYLFIWRIVRSASKDIRAPQESFMLAPQQAAAAGLTAKRSSRLVVVKSPTLRAGEQHELDSTALTVGRSSANDIELRSDGFASASHARFEPRRDGVWLEDVGSTNGTFVNGVRLDEPRKLAPGDLVRVGETDLRYEA
jgi:pSer/pThr/pTyr-binding forkhead associated (FHA) protein